MLIERAEKYINDIASGAQPAGQWIRRAMLAHLHDLECSNSPEYPYYFDRDCAAHVLDVSRVLKITKNEKSGQVFDLMPWHAALLYLAYGWRRKSNGRRRYKKVYCKVARGNAKTELLCLVGTYGFIFEGAKDPEIYWVATKKDQAKIGWERNERMIRELIKDEPSLAKAFTFYRNKRVILSGTLGWITYLGRDSDGEDGGTPYYGLIDEFHAHKDASMLNVIESGMVKREDTMTWIITTAGYIPDGPNSEFLERCKKMLLGQIPNDEVLAFIYELDDPEKWQDETHWHEANPSMGYSVSLDSLRTEFNKIATGGTEKEIDFKVKNLNIEYRSSDTWVRDEDWQACGGDIDESILANRTAFVGIDLSHTKDISSCCWFFPAENPGEKHLFKWRFWIPEKQADIEAKNGIPYHRWIYEGWINTTPGNVVDHDMMAADIVTECQKYYIEKCYVDPWNSLNIRIALDKNGLNIEDFTQSIGHLTAPTQAFERMILGGEMNHGDNPVMRWMIGNISIYRDANNNIRIHKGKEYKNKVDGATAAVNAIAAWMDSRVEERFDSYMLHENN